MINSIRSVTNHSRSTKSAAIVIPPNTNTLNSSYTMKGFSGLSIAPSDIALLTTDYTIEFWHNPQNYRPIIGTSGSTTTCINVIQIDKNNIRLECYGGISVTYTMPIDMLFGYWYNVVFVRQSSSTHACFVNGYKHSSFTVTNSTALPLNYTGFVDRIGISTGY